MGVIRPSSPPERPFLPAPRFPQFLPVPRGAPRGFTQPQATLASPPEDEHEGRRVGRAGEDPRHAGEHHEGQEQVGAAGAAGPGLGEAPRPVSGDAAALGVVLQKREESRRLLI